MYPSFSSSSRRWYRSERESHTRSTWSSCSTRLRRRKKTSRTSSGVDALARSASRVVLGIELTSAAYRGASRSLRSSSAERWARRARLRRRDVEEGEVGGERGEEEKVGGMGEGGEAKGFMLVVKRRC
ncbi:hypothetical protein AB1Y20_008193 [Prymnesium parvum]|uniref:Uncharacterized protein n=1 Tax=Prymnesium parvum TaxID=97485 RepID=A0AB34IU20_PRYPA